MAASETREQKAATRPADIERTTDGPVFTPSVDIAESETEVALAADIPGVDENGVRVDLDRNVLTIRARFTLEPPEGYSLTYREYRSGDYERSFTLGDTIDRAGISASVKDGVLRLTLPKAKEAQPRRITVKAG